MNLAGVNADLVANVQERVLSVVEATETISVAVVGELMIVPCRDPSKVLGQKLQIGVGAVLAVTSAVVAQSEDLLGWLGGSLAALGVFVEVVAEVDDVVMLVFSGSIAVCVEVAVGYFVSQVNEIEFRFLRKLLQEKTAKLSLETSSSLVGAVLVRPMGLLLLESQTLNW